MTLNQAVTKVRELTRTNSASASDTAVLELINEGQHEFAKDVSGLMKEEYVTITPLFDIKTNFAFGLSLNGGTATDVVVTSVDYIDCTAGTVATQLVTALTAAAATCTISWASASWYFTLTFESTITSAAFSSPTAPNHIDAVESVLGGAASFTAATCTGAFPLDCMVEASLPADFLSMYNVEWDGQKLSQAPQDMFISPEYTGTPSHYVVRNKKLRLYPAPNTQKSLHILYKYCPSDWIDIATEGAATITIDSEFHMAPVYYAASVLSDMNFEQSIAQKCYARYRDQVNKYTIQWNNQNPQMFPQHEPFLAPKIVFSSVTA